MLQPSCFFNEKVIWEKLSWECLVYYLTSENPRAKLYPYRGSGQNGGVPDLFCVTWIYVAFNYLGKVVNSEVCDTTSKLLLLLSEHKKLMERHLLLHIKEQTKDV